MRLSIRSVTKLFEDGERLNGVENVSLDVEAGEIVVVAGPSGVGKTTLLRLAAGLESPDSGEVTVNGESPRVQGRKGLIGLMQDNPALLPWRGVAGNVALPLDLLGRPESPGLETLIERVQLGDACDRRPGDLSEGMRQRVALARAFVTDPVLVLLDEPFARVDEPLRRTLALEIIELLKPSKSALITSHDLSEAVLIANRVVVLGECPAKIVWATDVRSSGPRTLEWLETPEFLAIRRSVLEAIDGAT